MPRKPSQPTEGEEDPQDFELAENNSEQPDEQPESEPENNSPIREIDDQALTAASEPVEPPADNERQPKPARIAKERKKMAEGKLPFVKVHARRLDPDRVKHPSSGMPLNCANQIKNWVGQYTRDEIEDMVHGYFGGGHIQVSVFNTEDNMKVLNRFAFKFPGDPNMDGIIGDCMTRDQATIVAAAEAGRPLPLPGYPPVPGTAYPQLPEDPVKKVELEAKLMEAEGRKREVEANVEEQAVEIESRRAAARRRLREMRSQEDHREGEYGFSGPERPPFRSGFGGPSRRGFYEPVDEMERPVSTKDLLHERQMAELREESRRTQERLERVLEETRKPKTDFKETLVAVGAVVVPLVAKMMELSNQQRQADRQSQENTLKLLTDSGGKSDKQMEIMIQALGVRDQRESNNFRNFSEMARLISDLSEGRGGGGIIGEIADGLGQVAQGITGAIVAAKQHPQHPQPVFVQPPSPPLLPGQIPSHGAAIQVIPGSAQPALPPGPQTVVVPQRPQPAPPPVQQPQAEGGKGVSDEDLTGLAVQILTAALQECDLKPDKATWVDVAFKGLPTEWVEMIAESKSYEDLAELVKPYAPYDVAIPLYLKTKSDPGIQPWLELGFARLQAMCREEAGGVPGSSAAAPAAPEETEPAEGGGEDEFGEEG